MPPTTSPSSSSSSYSSSSSSFSSFSSSSSSTQRAALLVMIFLDLFGVALVVPLLPKVFEGLGGDSEMWGVFSSIYSLAQVKASALVAGLLARRHGARFHCTGGRRCVAGWF